MVGRRGQTSLLQFLSLDNYLDKIAGPAGKLLTSGGGELMICMSGWKSEPTRLPSPARPQLVVAVRAGTFDRRALP